MTDLRDVFWATLDEMGEKQVRINLGTRIWNEGHRGMAQGWLAHKESLRTSEGNEASLAEARAANALAREANTIAVAASASAERSAVAALNNNRIAKKALAIAIIAMIIAAAGIFIR